MLIVANVELRDRKDGSGQFTHIDYVDTSSLKKGSRSADAIFASVMMKGSQEPGKIVQVKVKPYTYKDGNGVDVTTDKATLVVLADQTVADAARAAKHTLVTEIVMVGAGVPADQFADSIRA